MDKSYLLPPNYTEKKKISLVTETLTSLVVRSWKWQGGFQWVSQLPGQRTHSSPVLTSGISPPPTSSQSS